MAWLRLQVTTLFKRDAEAALPRLLPFGCFMAFIACESLLGQFAPSEDKQPWLWLYPIRIAVVLATLAYFWPAYRELRTSLWVNWREGLLVIVAGVLVYVAWVRMDWPWAMQSQPVGYEPFQAGATAGVILASLRLFGAAVVVPLMEELFWRSFLIRYLVTSPFTAVRLGTFTPLSCGVTIILFGLEHHLWLAGMMAGTVYNLLLYATGRLWPCILAHAGTNLLLGIHVLVTEEWYWW